MRVIRVGVAVVLVLAVALIAITVVASSKAPATKKCITAAQAMTLSPATRALPPSHDNDAGRARIPDATPDADNDAGQRPNICTRTLTP